MSGRYIVDGQMQMETAKGSAIGAQNRRPLLLSGRHTPADIGIHSAF